MISDNRIPLGTPCSACGSKRTDLACIVINGELYCLDCGLVERRRAASATRLTKDDLAFVRDMLDYRP